MTRARVPRQRQHFSFIILDCEAVHCTMLDPGHGTNQRMSRLSSWVINNFYPYRVGIIRFNCGDQIPAIEIVVCSIIIQLPGEGLDTASYLSLPGCDCVISSWWESGTKILGHSWFDPSQKRREIKCFVIRGVMSKTPRLAFWGLLTSYPIYPLPSIGRLGWVFH